MTISKKFILITGGSSGIGKQLAADLLKVGNKVAIVSNNHDRLRDATAELKKISSSVFFYFADIGDQASVKSMSEQLLGEHGCPDILVNCAGFATYRAFEETPMDEIERLVNVNLLGAMRCTRIFLSEMIVRKSGTIVNVSSIGGKMTITPNAVYGASKHGMVAWSEMLKIELARFNIDVVVICPGRVETAFFDHETFRQRTPRTETRLTIPVERVTRSIIRAMEKKNFITFIPGYYGLVVWLVDTFFFILKPLLGRLLSSRIESIYLSKKKGR